MLVQYKMQYLVVSRKEMHYLCENGIEKSVPGDHSMSSLGNPCDANR